MSSNVEEYNFDIRGVKCTAYLPKPAESPGDADRDEDNSENVVKTIQSDTFTIRIHSPMLSAEERMLRMKLIAYAATNLLLAEKD